MMGRRRFFRTGDIGELVGPGQVRVIDRWKSHFKLSQGLFVAPEPIEAVLRAAPLVSQAFVWGSGHMRAVAAVVVPSAELLHVLSDEGHGLAAHAAAVVAEVRAALTRNPSAVGVDVGLVGRVSERPFRLSDIGHVRFHSS